MALFTIKWYLLLQLFRGRRESYRQEWEGKTVLETVELLSWYLQTLPDGLGQWLSEHEIQAMGGEEMI